MATSATYLSTTSVVSELSIQFNNSAHPVKLMGKTYIGASNWSNNTLVDWVVDADLSFEPFGGIAIILNSVQLHYNLPRLYDDN